MLLNLICKLWKYSSKEVTPLLFLASMACCISAWADDVKPDGKWRGNGGAALSEATGNTQSSSLTITADTTRRTAEDKLSLSAQYVGSRARSTYNGVTSTSTTANQGFARSQYDHNITETKFGFGGLVFSRDQIQLLSLRSMISGGFGYHMIKTPDSQWNLLGGISYRSDKYSDPGVLINNQIRSGFDTTELLFSEDSTNKLSDSANFNQRLSIRPNISGESGFLVTFDSTLMVMINKTLSLRVSFQDNFNSMSQAPILKNDTLFFTGINVKFGE